MPICLFNKNMNFQFKKVRKIIEDAMDIKRAILEADIIKNNRRKGVNVTDRMDDNLKLKNLLSLIIFPSILFSKQICPNFTALWKSLAIMLRSE